MSLLLVDGLNCFLRNWCVVPQSTPNGDPIGGVIGFLRSLKMNIRDFHPSRAVVVWDGQGGSQRKRGIYADYKAGRKPRVNRECDDGSADASFANLKFQYAKLSGYLDCLGITQVEIESVEADDVVGFICRQIHQAEQKVIVSTDRDFLQLVDCFTSVYSPTKKKLYTQAAVREEWGVTAENFVFLKALMGDGSDNIKGVGGVGPKTALKLFPFLDGPQTTAEAILEHARTNLKAKPKFQAVVDGADVFIENLGLMELSTPNISAQSARAIRCSLDLQPPGYSSSALKLSLLRDGIQITDSDFFTVFESYNRGRRG